MFCDNIASSNQNKKIAFLKDIEIFNNNLIKKIDENNSLFKSLNNQIASLKESLNNKISTLDKSLQEHIVELKEYTEYEDDRMARK